MKFKNLSNKEIINLFNIKKSNYFEKSMVKYSKEYFEKNRIDHFELSNDKYKGQLWFYIYFLKYNLFFMTSSEDILQSLTDLTINVEASNGGWAEISKNNFPGFVYSEKIKYYKYGIHRMNSEQLAEFMKYLDRVDNLQTFD